MQSVSSQIGNKRRVRAAGGETDGAVVCLGKENLGRWEAEEGEIKTLGPVMRSVVIEQKSEHSV